MNWMDLGVDDGGLPIHLPMGLDPYGKGPVSDSEATHYICWCMDSNCLLTKALRGSWIAGLRAEERAENARARDRQP